MLPMQVKRDVKWPMDKSIAGKCDQCGRACVLVVRTCDPFIEEVEGRKTAESLWCWQCYQDAIRET